jgi:two-component sensor histidine kinase
MRPYADGVAEGVAGRVRLSGPPVDLPARMITPMGLLIHELATNGVKYGALSVERGVVEIRWQVVTALDGTRNLALSWNESGGPALMVERAETAVGASAAGAAAIDGRAAPNAGFGSRLTAMAAQQMGGTLQRSWPETGARVELLCPIS